jgi:ABC-type polysaccharide/polyol phosphate export permease
MLSMIYYFVFKMILKVEKEHYLPFILTGVFPWVFFSQSILESVESIVGNQSLISKIPIPLQAFPLVGVLTNLLTLLFSLPVLIGIHLVSGLSFHLGTLWFFIFILFLFLQAYSISGILAILFVYLRDLKHAISLLMQILFYATPVLYDESMVPEKYSWVLTLNPVGGIFTGLRTSFLYGELPPSSLLISSCGWTLALLVLYAICYKAFRVGLTESL